MALSESGNLRGTLDCRVETQGTEPQDGELFGEEEVSDAFEEGGGDHLMMAFLSRWRQGFPRPETDGTLFLPLRSGREKTLAGEPARRSSVFLFRATQTTVPLLRKYPTIAWGRSPAILG